MSPAKIELTDGDYRALADFRFALREFQSFSDSRATEAGLTPQQHQALLAIRGAPAGEATVGFVAQRLLLKPHSATGLVDRLQNLGFIERRADPIDRRVVHLELTERALDTLAELSSIHREEIRRLGPVLGDLLSRFAPK
jgi:DNA-binding MarR family transcriptional regulator